MNINELKEQLRAIGEKTADCSVANSYLRFYGLDLANETIEHRFGTFQSNGFVLAGHIFIPLETGRLQRPSGVNDALSLKGFKPINYKATVVVLHGYLSHSGLLSKITRYLVEAGFAVAVYDLPGHGLSSGEPTMIEDFSQYSDSLGDFMSVIRPILHGPYYIIGHSTGSAVIIDYLLTGRDDFDKIILTAPLVRSDLWFLSKFVYRMYQPFTKNIPRLFRKVSSDKDFLRFVRCEDPLQAKKVSCRWIDALFKWNRKITNAKSINRPVKVIQGTSDNIVAWKYNLKFIQSKFSKAEIELIENGRHELFNESAEIRAMVFSQIKDFLGE